MAMRFEELDAATRASMLNGFRVEETSGLPYRSKTLSGAGLTAFPDLMEVAIREGDETTLARNLSVPSFWNPTETYERQGVLRERRINVAQVAERLAITEFNTWYVRGLSGRLLDEGVARCQVYRASMPRREPAECSDHEGDVYDVLTVYDGHRARYWPEPGNPQAISIPYGPGCHHTIRRLA